MKILKQFAIFFFASLFCSLSPAGLIDLNAYRDSRDFSTLTINLLSSLPADFEYFSLVDYTGTPDSSRPDETEVFYTEQNLRWPIREDQIFSLSSQWVGASGPDNDLLRGGVLIRLAEAPFLKDYLDGTSNHFSINLFPLQFDRMPQNGWQIEYFYRFQILPSIFSDRFYLSGFADQNFDSSGKDTWVTEHQAGFRVYGDLYAALEHRYNETFPADRTGTGVGLQYLIQW